MQDLKRIVITGRAIPVRGNDMDTDRIIPARYLKCVVFDGLGEHAFEDDRKLLKEQGKVHAFDNPVFSEATILFGNKNFGCGSSREHAPQSIMRWRNGIKAVVAESFAEIFFGNCVTLGLPCAVVTEAAIAELMDMAEADPTAEFSVNVETRTISCAGKTWPCTIPDGPRKQFLEGHWDTTAELMEAKDQVAAVAAGLPYFNHWK